MGYFIKNLAKRTRKRKDLTQKELLWNNFFNKIQDHALVFQVPQDFLENDVVLE